MWICSKRHINESWSQAAMNTPTQQVVCNHMKTSLKQFRAFKVKALIYTLCQSTDIIVWHSCPFPIRERV